VTKIKPEQLNAAIRDIPLPDYMRELPVSRMGYPVPHFAGKVDGEWDFRVVYPETTVNCMTRQLCWVCGQRLGRLKSFVAGPMCVITRTSAEPPSHYSCAAYAAIACPFLAAPNMKRNTKNLPDGYEAAAGIAIMRNPGVTAVLVTRDWKPFRDGLGGVLVRMGEPERVEWYAHRRRATRAEVDESISSGLHLLRAEAAKDDAQAELDEYIANAQRWLP